MNIDFNNLKNKKVTVMGLGLLGGGVEDVKWLVKKGAKVLVTDLKTKKELKESLKKLKGLPVKYILGKHREKDFRETDLIIKNPAVPKKLKYLEIARKSGILIESDLSLFFRLFKGRIIGVTGTKGKSTTVTLIAEIFKEAKKRFIFGGNIGQSPLADLDKNYPLAILELSSWQLEDLAYLKRSPEVAVITTIFPDHLDRYRNFQEYIKAKKIIFKFQKKEDVLVLNYDNKITRSFIKEVESRVAYFSKGHLKNKNSVFVKGQVIVFRQNKKEKKIVSLKEIKHKYHLGNILAAVSVACIFGIFPKIIKKVLKDLKGLPDRLELVRVLKGVKYYNDTTATVPEAAIFALKSLSRNRDIILISGGADKKLNFEEFAQEVKKRCKAVILLPGTATKNIKHQISSIKYHLFFEVKNIREAVRKAANFAQKHDIVLLSPGCASFGLFRNAYDRAKQFKKAVLSL